MKSTVCLRTLAQEQAIQGIQEKIKLFLRRAVL